MKSGAVFLILQLSFVSFTSAINIVSIILENTQDIPFNALIPQQAVNENDIKLYLYTRTIRQVEIPLFASPRSILDSRRLIYILHGYLESTNRRWLTTMADSYLRKGDFQIVLVDWSRGSQEILYDRAKENSIVLGKILGNHIHDVHIKNNISLNNIHLIGHSMGAMMSGFAAKEVIRLANGAKVGRITALDPSGGQYVREGASPAERLDKTDADFVDVTHTDPDGRGRIEPIGHVDFYVNNGTRNQPGCPRFNLYSPGDFFEALADFAVCDHIRSHEIYDESINSNDFIAQQCSSWQVFESGLCTGPKIVYGENTSLTARGIFYLKTRGSPPYALGT